MAEQRSIPRRRLVVAVLLAVAVLVPYGYTFSRVWTGTGADLRFTADEQDGVTYLRPLVVLIGAATDVQSAAVRGSEPDRPALRSAVEAVDRADEAVGARLGVQQRWRDARQQLDEFSRAPGTGQDAVAAGGQAVGLLLGLAGAVGDGSNLILDPRLDSYYVMDAVLLRIPAIVVQAGLMADLRGTARDSGALPVQVAVAQQELRTEAAALGEGLRKSLDVTASRTLGPSLLAQLDLLQAGVATMAPPTAELGAAPTAPDAAALRTARVKVRDAALQLGAAGLDQLSGLVRERSDAASTQRTTVLAAGGAGAAVALAVLWFGIGAPGRRPAAGDDEPEPQEQVTPRPVADGDPAGYDLLDARELLDARQLVRVGRAVAPARDDP